MIEVLKFITTLRESDFYIEHLYLNGSCYQLHKLLKKLYPDAEPLINDKKNHVVTRIAGVCYDITGIVNDEKYSPLTKNDLRKAKTWSFRRNNLILLQECPYCEEHITYDK